MRAGPGLTRTTLCSVTTVGCFLTWETSQPFLTALGRNQFNFHFNGGNGGDGCNGVDIVIPPPSGLPSCLCSKTEQCEITGDNELDRIPNISEVREHKLRPRGQVRQY